MLSKIASEPKEEVNHIRYFNPASEDDQQELKNWCRVHWEDTICKGLKSFNVVKYHWCCICFSKKNYTKKSTHPPLQSCPVLTIPTFKALTSPEELYAWLKDRMDEHQRLGRRPRFPTVNTPHCAHLSEDEDTDDSEKGQVLKKRCQDLADQLKNSEEKNRQLSLDNQRLLASSKNWHAKYQELLAAKEDEKYSFAEMTPQKVLKTEEINPSLFMF